MSRESPSDYTIFPELWGWVAACFLQRSDLNDAILPSMNTSLPFKTMQSSNDFVSSFISQLSADHYYISLQYLEIVFHAFIPCGNGFEFHLMGRGTGVMAPCTPPPLIIPWAFATQVLSLACLNQTERGAVKDEREIQAYFYHSKGKD